MGRSIRKRRAKHAGVSWKNEKMRLQAQIRILETSQQRLETSISTADLEVDTLRRRLEQQQLQDNSGATRTEPARPANSRRP
jgi:hypothetical protein